MTKILVIGGTGWAGSFIAKEAQKRTHEVVVLSRSVPTNAIEGVEYVQGSATDIDLISGLLNRVDVVVATTSPRGDMVGKVADMYAEIAKEAAKHDVRFIVIGGFSTLRPASDAPRFFENENIPAEYKDEVLELASVFDNLRDNAPDDLDWLFISPAAEFGSFVDVADTGKYKIGGDVAIFDENGESKVSGADFAIGVVEEIENKLYRNENISITQ